MRLINRDGELYVDTPDKEVKVLFADDPMPADADKYDIVRLDVCRVRLDICHQS